MPALPAFDKEPKSSDCSAWLKKSFSDLKKSSTTKQVTVSALSGWCAGFVFTKFGKSAATALGGTLILLHMAHNYGYIKVDWKRVNQDMELAKKELDKRKDKEIPLLMEQLKKFIKDNAVLAGGFAGGFLLGMSSA